MKSLNSAAGNNFLKVAVIERTNKQGNLREKYTQIVLPPEQATSSLPSLKNSIDKGVADIPVTFVCFVR